MTDSCSEEGDQHSSKFSRPYCGQNETDVSWSWSAGWCRQSSSAWLPASSPLRWLMSWLFRWMSGRPGCCRAWQWPRRSAAELNERLSAWVAAWPADFWGWYPAEEPRGVLWSVILDPELHSGRIRNPKDLWASASPSAVTDSWSRLGEKRRRRLGGATLRRKKCRQTERAVTMSWTSTA